MIHPTRIVPTAAVLSAAALLATASIGLAQEEAPSAAHPVDIVSGTCEEVGDVRFPLGIVSPDLMVHSEEADAEPVGGIEDQEVALNLTLVDAAIDDLTAEAHALDIVMSESDRETRVACGDIAGPVIDDGTLLIRLDEHDDSGYLGIGLFLEQEDGVTAVYTMLTEPESKVESPEMAEPTPEPIESTDPTESTAPDVAESMEDAVESMNPDESMDPDDTTEPAEGEDDEDVDVTIDVDVEGQDAAEVEVEVDAEESPEA